MTITIDAATRSSLTPAGGAYWYMEMVNFNPGWGVLDWTANVQYSADFRPPFATETRKPVKIHAKADRAATHPGGDAQAQGTVIDANGDGVDGVQVRVELRGPLGVVLWSGWVTTIGGHFTAYVRVPASAADGTYSLWVETDEHSQSADLTVDSTLSGPA